MNSSEHTTLAGHTLRHELTVAANADKLGSDDLEKVALAQPAPVLPSDEQEYLENIVNEFL